MSVRAVDRARFEEHVAERDRQLQEHAALKQKAEEAFAKTLAGAENRLRLSLDAGKPISRETLAAATSDSTATDTARCLIGTPPDHT